MVRPKPVVATSSPSVKSLVTFEPREKQVAALFVQMVKLVKLDIPVLPVASADKGYQGLAFKTFYTKIRVLWITS